MATTQQLNRVFTHAIGITGDPEFLFSSLDPKDNIITPEILAAIAKSELLDKLMGSPRVTYVYDNQLPSPIIRVTPDLKYDISDSISTSKPGTGVWVSSTPGEVMYVNIAKMFDDCPLPHKYVLGCTECMRMSKIEVPVRCALHNALTYFTASDVVDCDDMCADSLSTGKTTTAGFTYISPMLTKTEHFSTRDRRIAEHDFTVVRDNADNASKGGLASARVRRFKLKVCPRCLAQNACTHTYNYLVKFCPGPYAVTPHQAACAILKGITVPFTHAQIGYLLAHSGELNLRLNRRRYFLTFHATANELQFGLRRITSNWFDFNPLTYCEAQRVIQTCGNDIGERHAPVTHQSKALLVALATRTMSPTRSNGWRNTSYPVLGITKKYMRGYQVNYTRGKTGYLPWTTEIDSFADLHLNWLCIPRLEHTSTPNGHKH